MTKARFANLAQWLSWQETLHPRTIDLGLERLRLVVKSMGLDNLPCKIITVGGTNGKGSTVALLEAILQAAGYKVGAYTSPHLLRYNERIRVNGEAVDDNTLCRSFAQIDEVRGATSLTYFEFGTLAALQIFRQSNVAVALLEVGLGGRLDAVNVVEPDVAVVTTVAMDHMEWLGPDREAIGFEKAGIFRANRPAICADPRPPLSLLNHALDIGASLYQVNKDYGFYKETQTWTWWHDEHGMTDLPLPPLLGDHQLANAAAALMAITTLAKILPVGKAAIDKGLRCAHLAARLQIFPGPVEWIVDVAHNVQSASVLAAGLKHRPCTGNTRAIVAMLEDKDAVSISRVLRGSVDRWYTATLQGPRGQSGERLAVALKKAGIKNIISYFPSVVDACRAAKQEAVQGDRIVVFGSFYTSAHVLASELIDESG
jgi:dihydrofolate synthase/folylpolyglutamate synthase